MSDIGFNSATNTNDFGGGMNTFTIDLRDLGNEKLLTIIYKMFYIEEYYFMNRNLKVCISSENGTQADIEFCFKREKCGRYPYYLSGNGFFNDLIEWWADYDAAIHLEDAVERYVNEALSKFRDKYNISAAITTTARETEVNYYPRVNRPIRITADNSRIWAGPIPIELLTTPRVTDTYASLWPSFEYLTADEYEIMKQEWRLNTWQIYMVMN